MKSWKIGALSGLIAGIVLGIAYEFFGQLTFSIGLYEQWTQTWYINNIIVNIPLFGFWGIIFGVIYSKAYNVIPREGVSKGLIYGLFLWFIITIRIETFNLAYGRIQQVIGSIFADFPVFLLFGIVLGILYDELLNDGKSPVKEKLRIEKYDMSSGIIPGAIAGFCGGMPAAISSVNWGALSASGELVSTLNFWMSQAGAHILINMIWGTVFGALFAKVYNLVPGEKALKGLYYGLIMFLITTFYIGTYAVSWALNHNNWILAQYSAEACWITGGAQAIVYGLVLGLLYRKPSK